MKKNQKIAIVGILLLTLALTVVVFMTTGNTGKSGSAENAPPKAGAAEAQGKSERAGGDEHETDAVAFSEEQISSAGIVVAVAGPAEIATTLTLPGEIRFNQDRTAHIVPRVDGVAESVPAELGQEVEKDQVLAVLASSGISELRSEALAAQKRLALAKTTLDREKKLWEDKISAEQDYLQARHALQEAEIASQNAFQKLRALGADAKARGGLNRFELRAPFAGMIVERHLSIGEAVQASDKVMTLSDLSTVWAEIVVSARDLNTVRVGNAVTVKAASFDSRSDGKISYVGALLGEQTRTATARVTLPNPDNAWRPGLFVNVEIVSGKIDAPVAVSAEAIQTVENKTVVFVRSKRGFDAVPVETGRTDGKNVEIVRGLQAGVSYAAEGSFVIKSELGKASAGHGH
ncbi:MAG: efflux RND transporter periplasmic adaptor subunit [Candidatus Accumulibacter sp.]|jgi:cobalt-zinc-cadmium efflux system membrane fusion protein|nr:efflux RND transporter periplasmic adaptor subunit [Accumulibacter sp.]